MGRYRITRQIRATPAQVFRAFTDPALVVDWMDSTDLIGATGELDEPGHATPWSSDGHIGSGRRSFGSRHPTSMRSRAAALSDRSGWSRASPSGMARRSSTY